MMNYLLTSSICLMAFYLIFRFFLKTEKLMQLQRIYLMVAVILSLLIPLIDFDWNSGNYPQTIENYFVPTVELSEEIGHTSATTSVITISNVVMALYIIGVLLMSLRLTMTLKNLWQLIRTSNIIKQNGVNIVYTEREIPVSSFFKYIFISKQENFTPEELKSILDHEKKHIEDKHSIDIILLEFTKILWWFNPFIYLLDRSLRNVHEFICDHEVVKRMDKSSYERLLINTLFKRNKLTVLSQFSEVSIKQRIDKLNQQNSNSMKKFKFLMIVPLTMALLWACDPSDLSIENLESAKGQTVSGRLINTEGDPIPGVNIVVAGTSVGTVSDIEGNYKITVPAGNNRQIVYAFIGLETQKIPVNGRDIIDVELAKAGDYEKTNIITKADLKPMLVTQEFVTENGEYFIEGQITTKNGEPISGTNVILLGSSIGTVADLKGYYKLRVPESKGEIIYALKGYQLLRKPFGELC